MTTAAFAKSVPRAALVGCLCAVSAWALAYLGVLDKLDNFLLAKRFALLSSETATNSVIVEIDTKSLQAMPGWPWSRSVHGGLVDVASAAGAKGILFDIDFSASSTEAGDAAFARSISQSSAPVFLAVHRQRLSADLPDIMAEILPNPALGPDFKMVSVNYPVDRDGVVRLASSKAPFSFGFVQSIGAALADRAPRRDPHYVDFSIDPDSIPRISYMDALDGRFDAGFFKGKAVFVGASAIELGDEYLMPAIGLRSGVLLNALSYETLRSGRELVSVGYLPLFLLSFAPCILLCAAFSRHSVRRYLCVNAAVALLFIAAPIAAQAFLHIIVPAAALCVAQGLCMLYAVSSELEKKSRLIFYSSMAARNSHALLATLVSDNHEGFIVVSRYGKVEILNARAASLLGLEGKELVGKDLKEVSPHLADHFDASEMRTGVIARFEMQAGSSDSESPTLDVTVVRSAVEQTKSRFERRKGPRVYVVFALHDISTQKAAENAERLAKEAHAAMSEAKTQLISNMTHELRTPLNAIIGFSDVLTKEALGPLGAAEYRNYARMINQGGRGLLGVLNDMLHVTTLQSCDALTEPSLESASELLEAALADAKTKISWKTQSIHFEPATNDILRADARLLQYALVHLIDNAAKFGGPTAAIRLFVTVTEDVVEIGVSDNGPGCDEAISPRLTEMFFQAESGRGRRYEGVGLGLFLVRRIAELHRGELTLTAQAGRGFTARIRLPRAASVAGSGAMAA